MEITLKQEENRKSHEAGKMLVRKPREAFLKGIE